MKGSRLPVRVAYVHGTTLKRGGTEAFMLNYSKMFDKKRIKVDFITNGQDLGAHDNEIERSLMLKIFRLPLRSSNPILHFFRLYKIFKTQKYDIVHAHSDAMNSLILLIAWMSGVPVRISHSHNTSHATNSWLKKFIGNCLKHTISCCATHLFACSIDAATWLYGARLLPRTQIINNAIDINGYLFNENARSIKRGELNISDSYVVGHVGRFDTQKNHDFIIDFFRLFSFKNNNAVLVLIGDGVHKERIEKKVFDYNLMGKVIFLGGRDDVSELLSSFDVFILPSLYEGQPIVAIEAQVNGLPCLISKNCKQVVDFTGNVYFAGLDDINEWTEHLSSRRLKRKFISNLEVDGSGFNISIESEKLSKLYEDYIVAANDF